MTDTETKFRQWAKKQYPKAFIKKIPDFKQMGSGGSVGLPDYLIINEEKTIWYEVKSGFGDTLTLKHFTEGQRITFMKMFLAGADINIYCFTKTKGRKIITLYKLLTESRVDFKKYR